MSTLEIGIIPPSSTTNTFATNTNTNTTSSAAVTPSFLSPTAPFGNDERLNSNNMNINGSDVERKFSYPNLSSSPTPSSSRPSYISITDDISSLEDRTLRRVGTTQALIDAIYDLDPQLVSPYRGDAQGPGVRYTVRDGCIGLGDNTGRALFFRPGQYRRIGFGCSFERSEPVTSNKIKGEKVKPHIISHMDITSLELPMGYVAVIQKGDQQYVIGPGRYLLRLPTSILGVVNLYQLSQEDKVTVYTEEPIEKRDNKGQITLHTQVKEKKLISGYRESIGAITFLRPSPGFRYATRSNNGTYDIGDTFKVMRSNEHFVKFLDYQKYSRTTKTFSFQSKDFQNVELSVQISWRLINGELWLESAGGYEDIFDALEEKAQALFRDVVSALSHEEALDQRKEGFETLERSIKPSLEKFAIDLGGELVDCQIRSMVFPLVLARKQELANREQENKEKLLTAERESQLQRQQELITTAKQQADITRKRELAEQTAAIERIEASRELAKVIAKGEREKAQLNDQQERQKLELAAQKDQAALHSERITIEAKSTANVKQIQAQQEAQAIRDRADAEAQAIISKAKAQAEAELVLVRAKAEGLRLMGDTFRSNPEIYKLEMARLIAETERVRAIEVGKALTANPHAFLPVELQRDFLRMSMNFPPEIPNAVCSSDFLLAKANFKSSNTDEADEKQNGTGGKDGNRIQFHHSSN